MKKRYSSECIVLARRNYSEADRILVVYSKHFGKVSLMAKGVRKLRSKKRGSIEVFSHLKFAASKGKNLDIITETQIVNSFNPIRENLKTVAVAYYFMEVVGRITREGQKNERLFYHLLNSLKKIKNTEPLRSLRKEFVNKTLIILGYWPKDKKMDYPDQILEEVVEREMSTVRVGKKMLS